MSQLDGEPTRAGYAGLWPRGLAILADLIVFCAVCFPITRLVKGVWIMSASDHRWVHGYFISDPLCVSFLIAIVVYYVLLEGLIGATVGKMLVGIRVVDTSGGPIGVGKSMARNALRLVDGLPAFCLLGIYLICSSPERARFGDRVAGTRVVKIGR